MKKFIKRIATLILLAFIVGIGFLFWPFFPSSVAKAENEKPIDVVLIGGGIMSATLGTYLTELEPEWTIQMYERLDDVAEESSNGWNNAGTGHTGFAEMNYTPEKNGVIDITKAVNTAENFEVSRQFWSHQVKQGVMTQPKSFINSVPHMSFVWGDDNVRFLKNRQETLLKSPLFYGMEYSEDHAKIQEWAPLLMSGRDKQQKVAATHMTLGTDVNFGAITRQLVGALKTKENFELKTQSEVRNISRNEDGTWSITFADLKQNGEEHTIKTKFVFIGAGGAAIKLLQLSGIPEAQQYAGFPVGGQFLVTENPDVVAQHNAKAYGKAASGSPPMSVPHMDTRNIDGKQVVLFGPFALYSTKFLKNGSWFDLFSSANNHNALPMWYTGFTHLDLVQYLIGQVMLTDNDRYEQLLDYYPEAKKDDWHLITAGQRVQIIKKAPGEKAKLQFGTELVVAEDKSLAALLGASPGASVSPNVSLSLLEQSFPEKFAQEWHQTILDIIPSYNQKLHENPALLNQIRRDTSETLELPYIEVPVN